MKLTKQYLGLQKEVYVICLCKLIDKLGSLIGPMFTLILSTKLGFDAATIAAWALVYTIAAFPANLLGGKLADSMNKKLLINLCDVTSSLIFILSGLFPLSTSTIVFYLIGCTLQEVESPSYSILIADITSAKDRERAHSLSYLSGNFGLILAPIIGGILLRNHANLIFIISGVMQLFSILVFDLFIKETKLHADKENQYEAISERKSLFSVLKANRPVFWFTMILGVTFLTYNQFTYILPLDFTATFGENGSLFYGTVSSVNCITVLVATTVVTACIAKWKSLDKMLVGEVFECLGFLLLFFCIRWLPMCYIASAIFTVGEIIETVTTAPYYLNRVPANYRGRINAFRETFCNLLVAVGNLGIGKLYDAAGSRCTWIVIFGLYVGIVVAFRVLKRFDKQKYPNLYA